MENKKEEIKNSREKIEVFKQWLVWVVLIPLSGLMLYGSYKQVIGGQQFGDKPMSDTGLLIFTGAVLLLTLSFGPKIRKWLVKLISGEK